MDSDIALFASILTVIIIAFVYTVIHDLRIWIKERKNKNKGEENGQRD